MADTTEASPTQATPTDLRTDLPRSQALATTPAASSMAPQSGVVIPPTRPSSWRKRLILTLVILGAGGFGGTKGYAWFTEGRFLVSTDDAYVKADMATIAAKIPGYIVAVPVVDNATVRAGDLLARIDDGDYRLAVEAAQRKLDTQDATIARLGEQVKAQMSSIDQARANLASSQADVARNAAEYDRATQLLRNNVGTPQRLEQASADRGRTAAQVKSATAAVASAEANLAVANAQGKEAQSVRAELQNALDRANRDLSFTEIRAPFDGIVGNRAVQVGQYVQPGTRLLALVSPGSVYVEANFKETQLASLKPGQVVTLSVDALSKPIEGTLQSLAPASGSQFSLLPPDNATGNFTKIVQRVPVRIKVPAEALTDGSLRPGLSVAAEVHTRDASEPPVTLMGALGLTRLTQR